MPEKSTSVILNPDDKKIVAKLYSSLSKEYGKVTFTFIVRQAIRALEQKIDGKA